MRVRELLDFEQERIKTLHYTWVAFFITFVTWFNLAPLATTMVDSLDWLSKENLKVLLICNVALTIPARTFIGALLDRFGPRKVFSGLLVVMSIPCFIFAFGNSLAMLVISRLALSFIGAGFVIGIRMMAEWFPPKDIGFAEGFYAGWGNFGSAAAALVLPTLALHVIGGEDGWRWSIVLTGAICLVYGFIYYSNVRDTPAGTPYLGSRRTEPMEVSSYRDLVSLILWTFPLYGALGVLAWKLLNIDFIGESTFLALLVVLAAIYARDVSRILRHNLPILRAGAPQDDRYSFSMVAALNTTYFANFGAELAVVSMLPAFFESTFTVSPATAGLVASAFAVVNLFARPLGGVLSDRLSNRRAVMLVYMGGIALGFFAMSLIGSSWPLPLAVVMTIVCSVFVQGAEGATFAIIPLVKKRMTGKIAGMVGAYGNVGAVLYLTLFTMVTPSQFFAIIGVGSVVSLIFCSMFLREPKGAFNDEYQLSSRDRELLASAP